MLPGRYVVGDVVQGGDLICLFLDVRCRGGVRVAGASMVGARVVVWTCDVLPGAWGVFIGGYWV